MEACIDAEANSQIFSLRCGYWWLITGPLAALVCQAVWWPAVTWHSVLTLSLPSSRVFSVLCIVCQLCHPSSLCTCSPWGIPPSFRIFVSICLLLPPAPLLNLSLTHCAHLFTSPFIHFNTVRFVSPLQWSHGFYLTHNQGQSGFEFFFKTKELKKKWLEQFGMAMWVSLPPTTCAFMHDKSASLPRLHFVRSIKVRTLPIRFFKFVCRLIYEWHEAVTERWAGK